MLDTNGGTGGGLSQTEYEFDTQSIYHWDGVIDSSKKTITVSCAQGTVVSDVVPRFTISDEAVAKIGDVVQTSGVSHVDLSTPKVYTVVAENGNTQNWTVTVNIEVPKRHWDGSNPLMVLPLYFKDSADLGQNSAWTSLKQEFLNSGETEISVKVFEMDCVGDVYAHVSETSIDQLTIVLRDEDGSLWAEWQDNDGNGVFNKIDGGSCFDEYPVKYTESAVLSSVIPSIGEVVLNLVEIDASE